MLASPITPLSMQLQKVRADTRSSSPRVARMAPRLCPPWDRSLLTLTTIVRRSSGAQAMPACARPSLSSRFAWAFEAA